MATQRELPSRRRRRRGLGVLGLTMCCCAVDDNLWGPWLGDGPSTAEVASGEDPSNILYPACDPDGRSACPTDFFVCTSKEQGTVCRGQEPAVPDQGSWACLEQDEALVCRGAGPAPSSQEFWQCEEQDGQVECRAPAYWPDATSEWSCAYEGDTRVCRTPNSGGGASDEGDGSGEPTTNYWYQGSSEPDEPEPQPEPEQEPWGGESGADDPDPGFGEEGGDDGIPPDGIPPGWQESRQRIGINFEDGGAAGSWSDEDYNDAVLCFEAQLLLNEADKTIISRTTQTVNAFFSRRSMADNRIRIEIHHADGSREPDLNLSTYSGGQQDVVLRFRPQSRLEVFMIPGSESNKWGRTLSHHSAADALVEVDLCRVSGD